MEYVQLGKSPVKISRIILGAWAIGGWMWGEADEKESIEAIQTSLENGINTIDTAAIYGMGYSEQVIAKALQGQRQKAVLATKCGMRWDGKEGSEPWPTKDSAGNAVIVRKNSKPESIAFECEQSLKRLKTDYIDLYQIHFPDSSTPIEESWKAMAKLKQQGKVKAIGVSNYSQSQLEEAHTIHPVDSIQSPYSLLRRGIEDDIIPYCKKNHISILAYSPLERGLLTGKVTLDRQFPKGDHRSDYPLFGLESRKNILEALEKIKRVAVKYNATLSQIVIQSTLQLHAIDAVIVGARNALQAAENAQSASFKLTPEEVDFVVEILGQKQQLTA